MSRNLALDSIRARRARLSKKLGDSAQMMLFFSVLLLLGAVCLFILQSRQAAYGLTGAGLLLLVLSLWDRLDLRNDPGNLQAGSIDLMLEQNLLASLGKKTRLTPRTAFSAAARNWQAGFLLNHLFLPVDGIEAILGENPDDMDSVWESCQNLALQSGGNEIHSGTLAAALLFSSPQAEAWLKSKNLQKEDVVHVLGWLERLNKALNRPKNRYGGIGRDWAAGFTPILDRFGENISREVEAGAGHYQTLAHADILDSVVHNLNQAGGSVALVGEAGAGKTALAYALAERLLLGKDEELAYCQVVKLNASAILSAHADNLERIMLSLVSEAVHAGNIIIFLDDARLFFGKGTGAFDASQVLMPLVQEHSVKLITAFTPSDFQHLKSSNPELAANMPSVAVSEPDQDTTLKVIEDTALNFEAREGLLITYQAVREAYRLSGQFMQELAYPGKAITLLEQAIPYADGKIITDRSVQQAIEKTRGVKVGKAEAAEADALLNLEDLIHQRMINQERAVKVVSAALRRGRAGVGSASRPIGSFLFLGPTGVGKTELARSLAATYFGDEKQMIRLDMSEFQQTGDVTRLLDTGEGNTNSLLIQIRQQPFSVVLLDEIEKSNPGVMNLLLQLLDEGQLTDSDGHPASFKNAVIIATSNAGSAEITARVSSGEKLDDYERPLIDKLIAEGIFKPELINRFDEVVLFRPLDMAEMGQVAQLMLGEVNKTLAAKNISVQLTDAALQKVVEAGYDPQFGARPMRRVIQRMVEDAVAKKVLSGEADAGTKIVLDVNDLAQL